MQRTEKQALLVEALAVKYLEVEINENQNSVIMAQKQISLQQTNIHPYRISNK